MQIKLAATCNRNGQQQAVKNNSELDEGDLEDLSKDYQTRPKQVY
jgi:hypothetical protein